MASLQSAVEGLQNVLGSVVEGLQSQVQDEVQTEVQSKVTAPPQVQERIGISAGHDTRSRMYWRFTPIGSCPTFWRLFEKYQAQWLLERDARDRVIAYGRSAVRFADVLRDEGLLTLSEKDAVPA